MRPGGVHRVGTAAGLAAGQGVPVQMVGAAHRGRHLPGAHPDDPRRRLAHHHGLHVPGPEPHAVDRAQLVGDPPQTGPARLGHHFRPLGQGGVLAPHGGERDRLLADPLGVGDAQHRDRLAVAREGVQGDGGGVLAAQRDARLRQRPADGRGVGADGVLASVGDEGHTPLGAHRQRQPVASDPSVARHRQVRALRADPEPAQRLRHGGGGGPHALPAAVQGEDEGTAEAHGDPVAVGERLAGSGGDRVVPADPHALLGEQFGDVVREGVQGARAALHRQLDGLVAGDEGGGAAREEGDHERLGHQAAQRLWTRGGLAGARRPPGGGPAPVGLSGDQRGGSGGRRGEEGIGGVRRWVRREGLGGLGRSAGRVRFRRDGRRHGLGRYRRLGGTEPAERLRLWGSRGAAVRRGRVRLVGDVSAAGRLPDAVHAVGVPGAVGAGGLRGVGDVGDAVPIAVLGARVPGAVRRIRPVPLVGGVRGVRREGPVPLVRGAVGVLRITVVVLPRPRWRRGGVRVTVRLASLRMAHDVLPSGPGGGAGP